MSTDNRIITYEEFDTKEHPLQEALCTLGNGFFACRGSLEMLSNKWENNPKGKDWNYPGTYLAGGYNRLVSKVKDREIENEDLVNWPNALWLTFRIEEDDWFDPQNTELLRYQTRLRLSEGILERIFRIKDSANRETDLISRRFVSMDNPHLAAIQWSFTPVNWSGRITLKSGIDGNLINNNVERYSQLNQHHFTVEETGSYNHGILYLTSRSKQSAINVTQAVQLAIFEEKKDITPPGNTQGGESFIFSEYELEVKQGRTYTFEKTITLYTSGDMAISDPMSEALGLLEESSRFDRLLQKHTLCWEHIWHYNDIKLTTSDPLDQLVTRLHIFHLYQTVSYHSMDRDVGIPARGWHGEAYRGHIFWDELYIQPFIDLHHPQLSRSLLMYRFRRLARARQAAQQKGFRGAMFPWQSGSNGREETQKVHLNPDSGRWLPDVSHLQYHINAAIPFNVWHYYQCTGDMDFLLSHGAEIILSSALFWSDLAHYNKHKDRYEIHKVMGPDEYHTHYPDAAEDDAGLNNNAYTNIMAVWVLDHALRVLELLGTDCCNKLQHTVGYNEDDPERWKDITRKMYVPFKDNIIMQFDGYDDLKELDWDKYHKKHGHSLRLDRILESEGDSCNRYKAGKQADMLMLFYLFSTEELQEIFERLGYPFQPEHIPENIEYYHKRTAHGSTLSQVIHAWVYARSHRSESWKRFRKALMSDFKDVQGGTTHEGIHLGAMAGTLDIIQRCYTGMEIRDDVLWFNPRLPDDIQQMEFHIRFRGHWIKLHITHQKLIIGFDKGRGHPVTLGIKGQTHRFETNQTKEFTL